MKINWKVLLVCIAIPMVVGGIAGYISRDSMGIFATLEKPPLSPPAWLFPVAWTVLYFLMGVASYLVLTAQAPQKSVAKGLRLYGAQLIFNFFWTIWFFNLQLYFFAFLWLVVLWGLIAATIKAFLAVSKPAALLLLPYLLWVTFAGYLNLGIALLN